MAEPHDYATQADLDALRAEVARIAAEVRAAIAEAHGDTKAQIDVAILSLSELIGMPGDSD